MSSDSVVYRKLSKIHTHTHTRKAQRKSPLALRGDKRIVILGDWLQYNSFAVWDGTSLFVDQFIEDEA